MGNPWRLDCVDASGARETAQKAGDAPLAGVQWWPLSDGSLLYGGATDGPTWRFDPVAMAVAVLDERTLRVPITSADGHVYAVAQAPDGTAVAVEVTPTAVIDIAAIDAAPADAVVVPIAGALLIGPGWTRVPR